MRPFQGGKEYKSPTCERIDFLLRSYECELVLVSLTSSAPALNPHITPHTRASYFSAFNFPSRACFKRVAASRSYGCGMFPRSNLVAGTVCVRADSQVARALCARCLKRLVACALSRVSRLAYVRSFASYACVQCMRQKVQRPPPCERLQG